MAKAEVTERARRYLVDGAARPVQGDAVAFAQEPREVQVEVLAELRARAAGDSWSAALAISALGISVFAALANTSRIIVEPWTAYGVVAVLVLVILLGPMWWVAKQQARRRRAVAWLGALEDELRMPSPPAEREIVASAPPQHQPGPVQPDLPARVSPAGVASHRAADDAGTGTMAASSDAPSEHDATDTQPGRHRSGPSRRSARRAHEIGD
ncbi:hypothetical protein [Naasia aerilata]|uniref:Uncharacterized protein n=1 Tax=Naasia aerilata TaxID=1162966 RepID=A0ABN6XPA3_9MICO|nr:hypothetical protein [Naasia aerilata]BDZ46827.1 hypothetical protein GCM10025866_27360 [Naasia aerilata]